MARYSLRYACFAPRSLSLEIVHSANSAKFFHGLRANASSNSTMAALLQIRWAMDLDDLALMRRIDELHLDYPFAGSQMLQTFLVREVAA